MLNEKKVFVDTISALYDQYILPPQDSADEDTPHIGPPRAKRMSISGEFPGKELNALHLPSKDIVIVEGSVIGYLQGHNIFGPCGVPALVMEAFKAAHNKHRISFSIPQRLHIKNDQHVTMKRLDFGVNLAVPEGISRTRLLVELAHKMIDKGIDTATYGFGETVYRNQYSQSSSQKFYDKAKQLTDTKGLPADLPNRVALLAFAETIIRSEIVLRYPKLKALEITAPQDCTFAMLKAELENAFNRLNLSGTVRAGLCALELRNIKPMYRTTYQCWENGDDLTLLLEAKAYKRQTAYFADELKFDITSPPPEKNADLVALGDVFSLSNAVEPPADLLDDDEGECAVA
jgi:hypothetical protein